MALNEEQQAALKQLFHDLDAVAADDALSEQDTIERLHGLLWKWSIEEGKRVYRAAELALQARLKDPANLGRATAAIIDEALRQGIKVQGHTVTGRMPNHPDPIPTRPKPRSLHDLREEGYAYRYTPPQLMVDASVIPVIEEIRNMQPPIWVQDSVVYETTDKTAPIPGLPPAKVREQAEIYDRVMHPEGMLTDAICPQDCPGRARPEGCPKHAQLPRTDLNG